MQRDMHDYYCSTTEKNQVHAVQKVHYVKLWLYLFDASPSSAN